MLSMFKSGFIRILISLCLTIIITNQLAGQTQHINFRHYSLADGLSSYKVVKVLQDRFGFMWIATQDGLNRFDGKDIIVYNKSAPEKHLLLGSDITDMVEDTTRIILWVITSYGGLNGIDLKTGVVKYAIPVSESANNFSHPWLKTLAQYKDELWIGTFDGITVYNINDRKLKEPVAIPFQKNTRNKYEFDINLFCKDEFGRIWVFIANYGLVIYSGDDYSIISTHHLADLHLQEGYVFKRFNSCKNVGTGQMLLATNYGIKKINYNNSSAINISDEVITGANNTEIRYLNLDREGILWFATNEGLYNRNIKDGIIAAVEDVNQVDQKKWINSINAIFFDKHNNLWLGTLQVIAVATKAHSPFLNYFQSADLKTKINRSIFIFPYNDSVEYVCAEDGFYRVDNAAKDIQRLTEVSFWFMFRHEDGKLIVSSDNRSYIFQPPDQFTNIEKVYPELSSISHETISSTVNWKDSLQYLGSERGNGVYEWDYKKRTLTKLESKSSSPFKSGIVNSIYKDKLNRIWILSDNSFMVYNPANNKSENYELKNPVTRQPLNLFFDICEASDFYWLASYGSGIIQLDKEFRIRKIISTSQGMANAGVYKIFPVKDTLLLSTSNNGLSKINIQNFSVTNYSESDGLHSNAFEEGCGTEYNGKIYAGGPNGFTIINTKYLTSNSIPPELFINNIIIETKMGRYDSSDLFLRYAKLPRNLLQATVYFSGLNYSNPKRTTYAYRIKGEHEEWINLGTQNFVNLIGLAPGTYTMQVKAFNEDGLASEIKETQLIFLPKWYQTWWFKILVLMAIAGIAYSLYRLRINQLKKEEKIRSQLAGDLHDDLGSTLNSVKIFTSLALEQKENTIAHLEKIKEITQSAITRVRDIIWVLDDGRDTLNDLLLRINQFVKPLCEAGSISYRHHADESMGNYKLRKEEKRNLYMIIKESINNCIKYANCKTLHLAINYPGGKLTIKISDDGVGFDKEKIIKGNGLKNILYRAKEIGYRASITSSPGNGTIVQLQKGLI